MSNEGVIEYRRQALLNEINRLPANVDLSFADIQKQAPALAEELKMALQVVNESPVGKRNPASLMGYVKISDGKEDNEGKSFSFATYKNSSETDKNDTLIVHKNDVQNFSLNAFKGLFEHEIGHNFFNDAKDLEQNKLNERLADRAANPMHAMELVLHMAQANPRMYSYEGMRIDLRWEAGEGGEKLTHPFHRERMEALLRKEYQNAFNGNQSENATTASSNLPVKLDNNSTLEKLISADLRLLDKLVDNTLTSQEIKAFMLHVEKASTQISNAREKSETKQAEAPQDNTNSSQHLQALAESFRQGQNSDHQTVKDHVANDGRMFDAYLALSLAKKHINENSHLDHTEKSLRIDAVVASISEGIRQGRFPNVEKAEQASTELS